MRMHICKPASPKKIQLAHASAYTFLTEAAGPTKIIKNVNLLAAQMKEKKEAELKEKAAAEAAAKRKEEEAKRQVCDSRPTKYKTAYC